MKGLMDYPFSLKEVENSRLYQVELKFSSDLGLESRFRLNKQLLINLYFTSIDLMNTCAAKIL